MTFSRLLTIFLLLVSSHGVLSIKDKATKIDFPAARNGLQAFGVGVRKKGPIKIYSVAMYCSGAVKEKLAQIKKSDKKTAFGVLRDGAKQDNASFLLQMNFKVGAEKMASAIADSVAPRHSGGKSEVESLKSLIFNGVEAKGSATKGTTFGFDCSNSGIAVSVDGKNQGHVDSGALAKAFCDVYLDDKCVSPALRQNCVDNCCSD